MKRANAEGWNKLRKQADSKSIEIAQQKTADAVASNSAIAERIRQKLLVKLEKEIDALPALIGSETRNSIIDNEYVRNDKGKIVGVKPSKIKEVSKAYKLRDLTAAYKDLTQDMPKQEDSTTIEKLDELLEVAWNAAHTETG